MMIKYRAKIINSSICFNIANDGGYGGTLGKPGDGGGIYNNNYYPISIDNCILSDNLAYCEGNDLYGNILANYNLILDLSSYSLTGDHNIPGISPEFIAPPNNLTLSDVSSAINAGNPDTSGLFIPSYDLLNNLRIAGDTIDLGAYEYPFIDGTEHLKSLNTLEIFPNPSSGKFQVQLPGNTIHEAKISIYNALGHFIKQVELFTTTNLIDLSDMPKGMYYVQFDLNGKPVVQKR